MDSGGEIEPAWEIGVGFHDVDYEGRYKEQLVSREIGASYVHLHECFVGDFSMILLFTSLGTILLLLQPVQFVLSVLFNNLQ